MANQYSPRRAGGFVHVTMDFKHGAKLAAGIAGDMRRADTAILETHKMLAGEVQWRQGSEFVKSVVATGRSQRQAVREGPVYKAILSPKNRSVNLNGFTVGYLNDKSRFPSVDPRRNVAQYAPGLEGGTSVHVGQEMGGYWVTHNGLQAPMEGVLNAIGFIRFVRGPHFVISRPIRGYHFQLAGYDAWLRDEYAGKGAREQYEAYFELYGLNFAARLFSRTGKKFTVSQLKAKYHLQE
jgi:hypothetical protein